MIPGEYLLKKEAIECNSGRKVLKLKVINKGDRPVQIGSHYHFFEVNREMEFDREKAYGHRLNIPSGTAVRFEPGESTKIELVRLGGKRNSFGLNNLSVGDTMNPQNLKRAMLNVEHESFKNKKS
ncbi:MULTISPECIES: urease subunit beta [Flavobacteriaceae]|uniref:Urease subunit beta n=2 Tax=Bizionia TaxID=283785 RepID=A0A8H2QLZ1_9FLAO|nr:MULTISPECIES: urease subunit beta [Flavobacteriaceae]TXD49451.1 urease subunit beta [Polaribacter sp. IC073]TYB76139.1 urease subunit beta [Bizionia saleffrena]TYC11431.1 urease subunit beta [Bizionia gelidisalsuginis]